MAVVRTAVAKPAVAKPAVAKPAVAKTAAAKTTARKAVKPARGVAPKTEAPRKVAKILSSESTAVAAKPVPSGSNGGLVKAAPQLAPRAPIAATIAKTTLLK